MKLPLKQALPIVCVGLFCGCVAGCGNHAPRETVRTVPPEQSSRTAPPTKTILAPQKTGVIYTVSQSGGDDNNLVAHTVRLAHTQSPARDALEALIHTARSPIPEGTTLRSVQISDGLATVDFSGEFQSHFHGSETEEAQTINSVLRTLGQFPSIERVQFLVDGKTVDALSQLPLSGPLDVLRPSATQEGAAAGGAARG